MYIFPIGAGAHLAGYTGQYMRDRGHMLGRITGRMTWHYLMKVSRVIPTREARVIHLAVYFTRSN
jgi:hypothetical protein